MSIPDPCDIMIPMVKIKITNKSNSPHNIGGKRLGVGKTGTFDVPDSYARLYEALPYFEVDEQDDELVEWRALYEAERGEAPDGRWSAKRIQKELGIDTN